MKRIIYSLYMLVRYRHELAHICRSAPRRCQARCVSMDALQGISVLVLDFDGVLAAHGEEIPCPEAAEWLATCVDFFGARRVFILTNKPMPARTRYFNEHYAGVRCVTGVKKKPYPDGLEKIIAISGVRPEAVMLLDDRLLTGVLAGCIAGIQVTYVNEPYISLSGRPVTETFFQLLRMTERMLVRILGFSAAR
ncbi:MAG: hypothetical protein GY862_34080 [Gammaproteobacteria bacterium]|nr:hypothetical protein [Gammaproteobacteria bacterium]